MNSPYGHFHSACLMCIAGLLACLAFSCNAQRKEIIGYFPSWKWNEKDNAMTPEKIPYDKLTIINYAFFYPRPDGSITGRDTVGDARYLGGPAGTRLTDLAHRHDVKVLLSLGGWEDSDNFPAVAGTPKLRDTFTRACMDAVRRYDFDGIDIDWEYPGYAEHKGSPADKESFTLLLQLLKDSLQSCGAATGRTYLLTGAFPASATQAPYIDFGRIVDILDQFNIMTYDFYGAWDPLCNHNSPLYPSADADSSRCMDAAFRLYQQTFGVPASKINLGLAFYGRTYTRCTALNSHHAGPDTTHFPASGALYSDIVARMGSFTRKWDDRAMVPYLVSQAWQVLVSYDDAESISLKAQYMLNNNVHGCIIWEITGDYLPDGTTPLLDAIVQTFASKQSTIH
jgi:chitinase